jgi:mono/diheme cytochrome c family protein
MSDAPRRRAAARVLLVALVVLSALAIPVAAAAQDEAPSEEEIALLQEGERVYGAVCAGCHQAGGVGVQGVFPPLVGNPNLEDAAYLEDVIRNGRQGPLVVDGITYDGVMPAFGTLTDDEIAAVIAYLQAGFVIPGGTPPDTGETLPVAGTTLPNLATMAFTTAFLLAVAVVAVVLGPRVAAVIDRRAVPWFDAWMKTAVIVVGMIAGVVFAPSLVLTWEPVTRLPRTVQELLGSGIWAGALGVGILALWWTHRESRI